MSDWISSRPVPLDHAGPVGIVYDPIHPEWIERSPIARFDHIADRDPDNLAVDDGAIQLTYREVRQAARALAHILHDRVPEGRPVLAVFRYTALFPAALLASIAAGRPIIPVDAAYPLPRQRMIVENAGAGAILVEAGLSLEVELPDLPLIETSLAELAAQPRDSWPAVTYDPDTLGGVTFTSGSTGNPKGLAWSFGAFMRIVGEMTDTHHINPDDKIIALGSLASAGLGDALFALLNGASLRVIEIMSAGIGELLRVLGDERITILSFIPAILRSVMAMDGAAHAFRHLRILDLYGDATLAEDVAFFRTKLPGECHIRLVLGSIEAGQSFHWFVPRDYKAEGASLPCGYLAAGKAIRLLDSEGQPVPPGSEGELVVKGRSMALGAWQGGRITLGPFLPDPDDARGRIYPMGDIVALREDGLCEFRGRRDRMVKVRGLRTDLVEIEAALRRHDGVTDVAVIALPLDDDNEIVAFCVARERTAFPPRAELRRLVGAATAEHMIPKQYHFLDAIPRLPNYKPDFVLLAAMASGGQAEEYRMHPFVIDLTGRLRGAIGAGAPLAKALKIDMGEDGLIRLAGDEVDNADLPVDCTVLVTVDDLQAITSGTLDPTAAFMTGKLRVDGDVGAAIELQSIFARALG